MTAPTAEPAVTADKLVEAGAAPVDVDPMEMLRQIQELQRRLDASEKAGQPADPIAAGVKDIQAHVKARMASHGPTRADDFAELKSAVDALDDKPTSDTMTMLKLILDEFTGGPVEGLDYIKQLVNKLHKLVVKG